jgi:hypothetical protein
MTTTRAVTHLIAIDSAGLLWGGVPHVRDSMDAIEREVRRAADNAGIDADESWQDCTVYAVCLLSKAEHDDCDDEMLPGQLVYEGDKMGYLPEGAWAAYGREV